jgi:hypothetical protein
MDAASGYDPLLRYVRVAADHAVDLGAEELASYPTFRATRVQRAHSTRVEFPSDRCSDNTAAPSAMANAFQLAISATPVFFPTST